MRRSAILLLSALPVPLAAQETVWLETLDLARVQQEWGQARAARSVDNHPLKLGGTEHAHGVGTHAGSDFVIDLKGSATKFAARVGVDDEVGSRGSVVFEVWVDGKRAAATAVLRGGATPAALAVDLTGARQLVLSVTDAGDDIHYDHADWVDAQLTLRPGATERPAAVAPPEDPPPVIAMGTPPETAIHFPRVVGASRGKPFLFRIPASGQAPLRFAAEGLPAGITLDPATGILSGAAAADGVTRVPITVSGPKGEARAELTIAIGADQLARTPPMGWNSWNVWAGAVDDQKVRAAADALLSSGLAAHGFQYVNIDDTWEGKRGADGRLATNDKFPDMKALADHVHSRGLKLGIYSSPGPRTCAGFAGSWQHEVHDAQSYAAWGIDLLKYDWCSYGEIAKGQSLAELQKPYLVMRDALRACGRDIVYSLCQYGMGKVWEWGADVGGHYWRTTGDITDSWSSMAGIGFSQDGHEKFAGPGRWNDPDMLVVGRLGWGPSLHPTKLSAHEQLTHISLWCLLAAPLLIGCDLSQLDPFTLAVLTNDEVLAVDQDPLGKAAGRVRQDGTVEVWARPLADGTRAVGLFNRGRSAAPAHVSLRELDLSGSQPVRNLWTRTDQGSVDQEFRCTVPRHGVVLVRIGQPAQRG